VTPTDCEIYRNVIVGVGRDAPDPVQTRGIQIGGASACRITDNFLADGPTIGIFVLGAGDTLVQNNVVVDFGEDGIYANDQQNEAIAGASYVFLHNTVVGAGDTALSIFGALTAQNAVVNNLLVASSGSPLGIGGDVDALEQGNLEVAAVAEAGFEDPGARDYRLQEDSIARDQGAVVTGYVVDVDRDGVPRDEAPDVGAYEYVDGPRPDGGAPGPDGGSDPPAAWAGDEDSGCGCRTLGQNRRGASPRWLALAILLLARRRRHPGR